MRILIANRGEIARRISASARRLGHETVAAFADPDRDAPFVHDATMSTRLGPAELGASYLSIEALLDAAATTGADAVHPGYGFLAERAEFAEAVEKAGLIWIGPRPETIASMGSKIQARRLAAAADVPIIPGYDASQDRDELRAAAERVGYPIMVKASAGGGGKGIRIAREPQELDSAMRDAAAEAERAFADGSLIVERFVERPRHVEVQIVGDRHGNVIDLGTRECSLQRRFQKIVEEAPAANLSPATSAGLRAAARGLAESIGYESAGTVEFIVDDTSEEFFFLEMNTRLQVEHPVTELVTGVDLVELQLGVAQGRPLPLAQDEVVMDGHAFEVRINAEDPWRGFLPQTGTLLALEVPAGARWDSGVEAGSVVSTHYDPMIAKLIVDAPSRDAARQRMIAALDDLVLAGLTTNAGFVRWLLEQPEVVDGRVTTRFVDNLDIPAGPDAASAAAVAAQAWQAQRDRSTRDAGAWAAGALRLTPHRPRRVVTLTNGDDEWEISTDEPTGAATPARPTVIDLRRRFVAVNVAGATHTFGVPSRQERWARRAQEAARDSGALTSPFPATIADVHVAAGDLISGGDVVVVIEAMKMLHPLTAGGTSTVSQVHVAAGDQVDSGEVLVTFEAPDDEDGQGA